MTVHAVTPERWSDLQALFERPGPRGGVPIAGHCWCMGWREHLPSRDARRQEMENLVQAGREPGLLAYLAGRPVGWVSVGRRDSYGRLQRSRDLRPRSEDPDVHVIACFYVDTEARNRGVAGALLDAAIEHARASGAAAVEGYPKRDLAPHAQKGRRAEELYSFMGRPESFASRGFRPVREAGTRTVMRLDLVR